MNDRLKFPVFGGGLVLLFGAALGIGALVGDPAGPADSQAERSGKTAAPGFRDSESGYTLSEISAPAEPDRPGALRFRITGPDNAVVSRFTTLHEKNLHLIVVRA